MKFNKLFEQDFKIVENKKKVFIAPVVILVIALIAGIVFHFVSGSAFNLGMDFTGGYTISVNLGNKLTDDTYDYYKDYAVNVAEELKDSEGNKYGIKISSVQRQGEADTAGLLLKYKAVGDEEKMETVNEELKDALSQSMFFFKPTIALNDAKNGFTATYDSILLVGDYEYTFTNKLNDAGFDVKTATISDDKKSIAVTFNSAVTDENAAKLEDVMTISDNYGGMVSDGGQTSSTVSSETQECAFGDFDFASVHVDLYRYSLRAAQWHRSRARAYPRPCNHALRNGCFPHRNQFDFHCGYYYHSRLFD